MPFHHDQELNALKEKLLRLAGHAESALVRAVQSAVERDDTLARRIKEDDALLDRLEMEVDDMAIHLLAHAPLASDLRLITMTMKISRDLERVGDEATTISRRAIALCREPRLRVAVDIPRMATIAREMLRDALDAFVQGDSAKARAVIPRDREVDRLHKELQGEMIGHMEEDPGTIHRCLSCIVISKSLERIADHATNIAEGVVYLCEGRDIRHIKEAKGG